MKYTREDRHGEQVKALEQRLSDLLRRAEEIEEKVMEIQMKQAAAEMAAAEGRET